MKLIKTILLSFLLVTSASGQNVVDIKITDNTDEYCELTLYPQYSETSILSCVVFTLKWKNYYNIAFDNSFLSIPIYKSGPTLTDKNWKYQIFYGLGYQTINISKPIVIKISKSGNGLLIIADDEFINQLYVNGAYYVSIGGIGVTGEILYSEENKNNNDSIYMYYDPQLQQYIIIRDNKKMTLLGQRI
jgi:hypothetical protein